MIDRNWIPTEELIDAYFLYKKMLSALALEVRELSKKKQEGTLNLTKVRMINRVLQPLKEEILLNVPASIFLDLLDEAALPNNSDAVLIISQYEAALKEFEDTYYIDGQNEYDDDIYYWVTEENPDGQLRSRKYRNPDHR